MVSIWSANKLKEGFQRLKLRDSGGGCFGPRVQNGRMVLGPQWMRNDLSARPGASDGQAAKQGGRGAESVEIWGCYGSKERLPIRYRKTYLGIRVECKPGHIDSQPPVEDRVPGEIRIIPEAIRARRLAIVYPGMVWSEDIPQERAAWIGNESKQTFQFGRLRKLRAVARAVFEAVGEKRLSDHMALLVPDDSQADPKFRFIDIEKNRDGAANEESE